MPRFFVRAEEVDREGGVVRIEGDDARHIARSLRMAVGDELTVCDGSYAELSCKLTRIRDEECTLEIISERISDREPACITTLYMAYPKGDKLETVIQKAVELGASRIVPFESSRCIKRPKAEKIDKITSRQNRIAEEAAKQCGRARIPEVCEPMSFGEMLADIKSCALALLCYEGEEGRTLKSALPECAPESIAVIVGAEGGFSEEEASAAEAAGAISVSLGRRILRCETAPSYVLSAISYQYEL